MIEQHQFNELIDATLLWVHGLEEAIPDPPISAGEYIAVAKAFDNEPESADYTKRIAALCEAVSML